MCLLLGLERTDNNMDLTTWPQINPINQKNYYTYVTNSKARSTRPELLDGFGSEPRGPLG